MGFLGNFLYSVKTFDSRGDLFASALIDLLDFMLMSNLNGIVIINGIVDITLIPCG